MPLPAGEAPPAVCYLHFVYDLGSTFALCHAYVIDVHIHLHI